MNFHKDQKGFTMVELVIVTAVIMLMAVFSVTMIGRLRYAKTEQVVEAVFNALRKHQINCMSKGKTYLHIYKISDEYFIKTSDSFTNSCEDTNGYSLGSNVTIKKNEWNEAAHTEVITEINGTGQLIISYKKDGSFDFLGNDIREIIIVGQSDHVIKLNKSTGKSVLE